MLRNTENSWGSVARFFHWSIALLIVAQIVLGIMAVAWRLSPTKLHLFIAHKSVGILILGLMAMRLLWRFANPTPILPAYTPNWQRRASRISHGLLYLILFALPLSGWVIQSASNVPFRLFWLFPLPAIAEPDKVLAETMKMVHAGLVGALVFFLGIHIGAALHHHFVRKDWVLKRMWSGK